MSSADIEQGMVHEQEKRLTRHTLATRLNHWLMAGSILLLVFTSFLPIQGIKFAWVTIHWVAGLVFTASIIFHTIYALICQDWRSMWVELKEFSDLFSSMAGQLNKLKVSPGKYWLLQKLYHHAITEGLKPDTKPRDAEWGERYFHITDPDGHELSFARPLGTGYKHQP